MRTVGAWHRRGRAPCDAVIRDVVPELREEGREVVLMDVSRHPCAARDARIAFDYQSVCHCSKTRAPAPRPRSCLITSQFATAPKRDYLREALGQRLITSQFATAPKREAAHFRSWFFAALTPIRAPPSSAT